MTDNKLKGFLKSYAEILGKGVDITSQLPLYMTVKMAQGGIEITTNEGKQVGYVIYDDGGGPSMPVGPTAMTFARLFVELVNGYAKSQQSNNNSSDSADPNNNKSNT